MQGLWALCRFNLVVNWTHITLLVSPKLCRRFKSLTFLPNTIFSRYFFLHQKEENVFGQFNWNWLNFSYIRLTKIVLNISLIDWLAEFCSVYDWTRTSAFSLETGYDKTIRSKICHMQQQQQQQRVLGARWKIALFISVEFLSKTFYYTKYKLKPRSITKRPIWKAFPKHFVVFLK